jgi:hypothetical protein
MIPNMHISAISRTLGIALHELPVDVSKAPDSHGGVTWKAKFKALPSLRFVRFCIRASIEWMQSYK